MPKQENNGLSNVGHDYDYGGLVGEEKVTNFFQHTVMHHVEGAVHEDTNGATLLVLLLQVLLFHVVQLSFQVFDSLQSLFKKTHPFRIQDTGSQPKFVRFST